MAGLSANTVGNKRCLWEPAFDLWVTNYRPNLDGSNLFITKNQYIQWF